MHVFLSKNELIKLFIQTATAQFFCLLLGRQREVSGIDYVPFKRILELLTHIYFLLRAGSIRFQSDLGQMPIRVIARSSAYGKEGVVSKSRELWESINLFIS